MSKRTLNLIIGLIVIVFVLIVAKGFMILGTAKQISTPIATTPIATTTSNIPDNLSISNEIGG